MTILWVVYSSIAVLAAASLRLLLKSSFGVSPDAALYCCVGLWFLVVVWLWVVFVVVGRESADSRISTADLSHVQKALLLGAITIVLVAPAREKLALHDALVVAEWTAIGFQVVYFSLAWATRANVPVDTYVWFLCLLALTLVFASGTPPNYSFNPTVRRVTALAEETQAPRHLSRGLTRR